MTETGSPRQTFGRFALGSTGFIGMVTGGVVHRMSADRMADVISGRASATGDTHPLSDLKLLAPIDRPSKVICIGLNYRSHIREMRWETPKAPIIFTKPSSAIIGPGEAIVLPEMSRRVDYEGESAVVIGSRAKDTADGGKHIFGYTGFNDVTARDLQKDDPDWTRSKGFDTFAPVGPFISPKAPSSVTTRLNGRVVQQAPTEDRVFGDAALVEYISRIMTLEPGDLIATGTPSGISPMKAGDVVEVELDGIGVLANPVVAEEPSENGG
ncbi:MAG: fumarylacetoacetate hydrolase family protein [Methanobacteriota archaeon]|nr:MAG: fumarylacetoacetate hydrolase family protein [Euryarchaeota archaeon]